MRKFVPPPMFGRPIGYWHETNVWLPVEAYDGRKIMFSKAWRRRIQLLDHLSGGQDQWWQYATYTDHKVNECYQLVYSRSVDGSD